MRGANQGISGLYRRDRIWMASAGKWDGAGYNALKDDICINHGQSHLIMGQRFVTVPPTAAT